jgi:DNA topoisomerase-1
VHRVTSDDVNIYLREITGEGFPHLGWDGADRNCLTVPGGFREQVAGKEKCEGRDQRGRQGTWEHATVCRKCYIHPTVLETYLDGKLIEGLKKRTEKALTESLGELCAEEAVVLAFLQEKLAEKSGG